jgi:hypothetical protein
MHRELVVAIEAKTGEGSPMGSRERLRHGETDIVVALGTMTGLVFSHSCSLKPGAFLILTNYECQEKDRKFKE